MNVFAYPNCKNSGEQHPIFDFFFPDLALPHITIIDIFCHTVKSLKIAASCGELFILVDKIHVIGNGVQT
jgi:hypothetical protein